MPTFLRLRGLFELDSGGLGMCAEVKDLLPVPGSGDAIFKPEDVLVSGAAIKISTLNYSRHVTVLVSSPVPVRRVSVLCLPFNSLLLE